MSDGCKRHCDPLPHPVVVSVTPIPPPGSDSAVALGCRCPVLDNCHGRGYYAGRPGEYVYADGCPLHCPPPE